jgi:Cu/Ag efflux protein CusF
MRKFFFAFLLIPLICNAQKQEYPDVQLPVDEDTKLITYSKVVEFTAGKDSVYNKSVAWFHAYFKNPTGVIREKSPETGEITGKHQIKILNPPDKKGIQTMKGLVQYTVKVSTKDNKVRVIITEFNLKDVSYYPLERWTDKNSASYSNVNQYYLEQIDKEAKALQDHFTKFMTEPLKQKNDNW